MKNSTIKSTNNKLNKTLKLNGSWKMLEDYKRNGIEDFDEINKEISIIAEDEVEVMITPDVCCYCNSVDTVKMVDDGFPTCTNPKCGVIYKNVLDYSPEWNSFGKDDKNGNDPTRCGNPINPLLKESSFACKVMRLPKTTYEMRVIERWIEWQSMPHKEKSLYDEFQYITNIGKMSGIPMKIIDDALEKHKDFSEQQMFRGANRDSIKAASIYIAFQKNGFPRTASEIARIFMLDKKNATKGCAIAVDMLNHIERNKETKTELCTITPLLLIERYCSPFDDFSLKYVLLGKFIANKIENDKLILDNTPQAIASGIIYFISTLFKLNVTKMEIIKECQISDVTLNKCYKKLIILKDKLIPPQFMV